MCGFGSLTHSGDAAVTVKPASCRSWGCETCGPVRRALVEISARLGEPSHFLTLTIRRGTAGSPLAARQLIGKSWPLLMRRLARHVGVKRIPYLVVIEAHKSGWPHLHALLRSPFLPHAEISRVWRELTGSPVAWIEKVSSGKKAAKYVAKYLGKSLKRFGTSKRYWSSRDWVLNAGDEEAETWRSEVWSYTREQVDEVLSRLIRDGYHIVPGAGRRGERVAMRPRWQDYLPSAPPRCSFASGAASSTAPPLGSRRAA